MHKDDLVNVTTGEIYKAWVRLDLEGGKENGNFKLSQFHDPQYGFDLSKVLEAYKIKELEDPGKREQLETKLSNGERPLVTVDKEGQQEKVFIETAVRYSKLNFFALDGKMEKRELFQKAEPRAELSQEKASDQSKQQTAAQGMGV